MTILPSQIYIFLYNANQFKIVMKDQLNWIKTAQILCAIICYTNEDIYIFSIPLHLKCSSCFYQATSLPNPCAPCFSQSCHTCLIHDLISTRCHHQTSCRGKCGIIMLPGYLPLCCNIPRMMASTWHDLTAVSQTDWFVSKH